MNQHQENADREARVDARLNQLRALYQPKLPVDEQGRVVIHDTEMPSRPRTEREIRRILALSAPYGRSPTTQERILKGLEVHKLDSREVMSIDLESGYGKSGFRWLESNYGDVLQDISKATDKEKAAAQAILYAAKHKPARGTVAMLNLQRAYTVLKSKKRPHMSWEQLADKIAYPNRTRP